MSNLLFHSTFFAIFQFDDLLSSSGMADTKTLAARFGMDITTEAFWRSSLDVIRKQIVEFERLVGSASS